MLEKLNTEGYETISRPQYTTIGNIKKMMDSGIVPVVAEVGIGIGATTRGICEVLAGQGELHIFDFQESVDELVTDLSRLGFTNVVPHGNTEKYWDSYHWSLMKLLQREKRALFDYVYLDGAHTLLHDTAAFFLADKLLKIGGTMDLDDYNWTFSSSKSMIDVRHDYMTEEQEMTAQVKMVVDTFINNNSRYETLVENRIFRKLAD